MQPHVYNTNTQIIVMNRDLGERLRLIESISLSNKVTQMKNGDQYKYALWKIRKYERKGKRKDKAYNMKKE